ncbi:MAG: winged helix-turn-helix transcriptional regulator, partial [Candidatus Dojkabacteria bacterium]
WSLLILRDLIILNKRHYKDFLNSKEKIATNILADRLDKLLEADLIIKTDDPKNKSSAIYIPTEKALELLPTIFAIMNWGLKHNPNTDLDIPVMQELQKNDNKLKKRLVAQFK